MVFKHAVLIGLFCFAMEGLGDQFEFHGLVHYVDLLYLGNLS